MYLEFRKRVCVVGLGYIGLSTACILADHGYSVFGVDIDKKVIAKIKSANFLGSEPKLQDLLLKVIANNSIELSMNVVSAEIFIITVPTPLDAEYKPDISYVDNAIESIMPHITSGNLVLIESTCPIGTTELMAKKLQSICPNIHIAYCPERVLPGNIIYELIHNDRIVGGIDNASTSHALEFYKSFISGEILATDTKTAEAIKLAENTYRDINIAYANELSMIADHLNLNVNDLIRLANRHPRVNILQPGVGVGGHCIAVDPYFLISSAPNFTRLISNARKVNDEKTKWVVKKISNVAKKNRVKFIACLGLTYKPNVSDVRNSPALEIVQLLNKEFEVFAVDPYVEDSYLIDDAVKRAEMIVILVAHNEFMSVPEKISNNTILLDFTSKCE